MPRSKTINTTPFGVLFFFAAAVSTTACSDAQETPGAGGTGATGAVAGMGGSGGTGGVANPCGDLASACHSLPNPTPETTHCHEVGHDGNVAACQAIYADCMKLCMQGGTGGMGGGGGTAGSGGSAGTGATGGTGGTGGTGAMAGTGAAGGAGGTGAAGGTSGTGGAGGTGGTGATGGSGGTGATGGAGGTGGSAGAGGTGATGGSAGAGGTGGTAGTGGTGGSGATGGTSGTGGTGGAGPECQELVTNCGFVDMGTGPIHDCVVTGQMMNGPACVTAMPGCVETCGAALCTLLSDQCHDTGPIECHDLGHAGVAEDCFEGAAECLPQCT